MPDMKVESRRLASLRARRQARPMAEVLEDRILLYATSGGRWTYGGRVSYSIVPDGTGVGGGPSNLIQSMNARFGGWGWLNEVKKAAAAWQEVAEINLAMSWDNGAAVGSAGNQQGDARFGDIRIGGAPLASGTLAVAYATPPFNGGTLAGDIIFNTNIAWGWNSTFDLRTVAVHEFGHALGLSHSSDLNAAMYPYLNATKPEPAADDVLGSRAIYGTPRADVFDVYARNEWYTSASPLSYHLDDEGKFAIMPMDITGEDDQDWYSVVAPQGTTGALTVTVQTTNISSLSPELRLYRAVGGSIQQLVNVAAPGSYGATLSASIGGVAAGQTYYVRVVGASSGADGQGTYGLLVNFGSGSQEPLKPYTVVTAKPDQGGGSSGLLEEGSPGEDHDHCHCHDHDHNEEIAIGTLSGFGHALEIDELLMPAAQQVAAAPEEAGAAMQAFAAAAIDQTLVALAEAPAGPPAAPASSTAPAREPVRAPLGSRSLGARPNGGTPAVRGPSSRWASRRPAPGSSADRSPRRAWGEFRSDLPASPPLGFLASSLLFKARPGWNGPLAERPLGV